MAIKKPLVINDGVVSHLNDDDYLDFKSEQVDTLQGQMEEVVGVIGNDLLPALDTVSETSQAVQYLGSNLLDAFGESIFAPEAPEVPELS